MCGIAGCIDLSKRLAPQLLDERVGEMVRALVHRGPDDKGRWQDSSAGIALGHCRLAILDLSEEGRQPMTSADGRFVATFNGEIYNHADLREELLRARPLFLRGRSDTEVLVEAFAHWGVEKTVERLNGMFAIAAWDRESRELSLCRDRFGEKPLYYTYQHPWFYFASELKALVTQQDLTMTVDPEALPFYAGFGYLPDGASIYKEVRKLSAGCILAVALREARRGGPWIERPYWSAENAVIRSRQSRFQGTENEAVAAVRDRLGGAVKLRMTADVPLGSLLSGGIDSSLVTAIMQAESVRPIRTFTIGFPASSYDEGSHSDAIARRLGTEHSCIPVMPKDILHLVTQLPSVYDEPFADSSQLPTLLVAKLARQHVTVALTGDGGDEVFGGYNRYRWALRCSKGAATVSALKLAAALIGVVPDRFWQRFEQVSACAFGDRLPFRNLRSRSCVISHVSAGGSFESRYASLTINQDLLRSLGFAAPNAFSERDARCSPASLGPLHWMMYRDAITYLPGDILVKVDRASMACGLESRLPFLDPALVDLGWSLPPEMLLKRGRGKWILRRLLGEFLPPALFERPKRGFSVPLGNWLRGPLREWAGDLLSPTLLSRHRYFRPGMVAALWKDHLSGRRDFANSLWPILMFNAWYMTTC